MVSVESVVRGSPPPAGTFRAACYVDNPIRNAQYYPKPADGSWLQLADLVREFWAAFMSDVSRILSDLARGDSQSSDQLLPLVYEELRKLAAIRMADEAAGHTLNATALVHEAYLRLVGPGDEARWDDRGHFFAAAAEAMRRLLVENARRKKRTKHGGDRQRISLEAVESLAPKPSEDLLALDEALTKLAAQDPTKAEVVKLRFFAGLKMPEIARVLNISLGTVERYWTYARTWLYAELSDAEPQ